MGSLRVLIKGYKSLKLYYLCILCHQVDESSYKGKPKAKSAKKILQENDLLVTTGAIFGSRIASPGYE
jgi:hypothetical protein